MSREKPPIKGVHTGGAAWNQVHTSIARAGLDLLVQQGYGRFTVDNLAAFSGINRRTIYRHYPSRVDLAIASIHQMPVVTVAWPGASSPRQALLAACQHASFLPLRLPGLLATAVTHADDTPELLAGVRHIVLRPRAALIAQYIKQGQHDGFLRPVAATWHVSALINGLLIEEALGTIRHVSRAARARSFADAIWHLTAVDPEGDGTAQMNPPDSRRKPTAGARRGSSGTRRDEPHQPPPRG